MGRDTHLMLPATALNIRICFMAVCRGVKSGPHGLTISGVTNQLSLAAGAPDSTPLMEAAVTLVVSIFLGDDGRKKSVPFVLTVITPREGEKVVDSFRVDKESRQTIDTRVISVALQVSEPGMYWLKLYSRQRELHRIPLDIVFKDKQRAKS